MGAAALNESLNISDWRPFVWVSNLDGDSFGRAGKKKILGFTQRIGFEFARF